MMEATNSVAVSVPGIRKEWRAVSDQNSTGQNEDLDRSKQGDERLIYEVQQSSDFFSLSLARPASGHDFRLDDVIKQREQLQNLELNLKARLIATSQLMEMQDQFDSQIKHHVTTNLKLQEQLHASEKTIQDLQRTLLDKDKELHAVRLDHEAAWAKEDLLREQNKELATFRRELDNSEAERAQHIKKIHDLQEHIQEKDQQLIEMQEQYRVAQGTIIYKDEQIREAQAWITRAQEMDVLQSTTNHSLQAELRERMEQYNQLWLGCQRQFTEMERVHLHAVQQLQLELSEARERNGTFSEETHATHKDNSNIKECEQESNGGISPTDISKVLQIGNIDIGSSFALTGNASTQSNQIPASQMAQSLHGIPPYLPPGQLTALHPYVMHQQGLPHNMNGHLVQYWQSQQALSDGSQVPSHEHPSQNDQNLQRLEISYDHISQGLESHPVVPPPNFAGQVHESTDNTFMGEPHSQHVLQHISSKFRDSLKLNLSDNDNEYHEKNVNTSSHEGEAQSSTTENFGPSLIANEVCSVKFSESTKNKVDSTNISEGFVGIGQRISSVVGKTAEKTLLDEESLLACVVRTIPPGPGGRIRISETLLNRLNKMLAPLNWSDYMRKYGKLDDFLAVHPELFFIKGDHIQVREGAQEIIAGMAAHAKVRAAAVANEMLSKSSLLHSVAVTPMAQSRLKKNPSISSNSAKAESRFFESQLLGMQNQLPNGVSSNAVGSISNVRILSKHNDQMEQNASENSSIHLANGNGRSLVNRTDLGSSQTKVICRAPGKQQGRPAGGLPNSRR